MNETYVHFPTKAHAAAHYAYATAIIGTGVDFAFQLPRKGLVEGKRDILGTTRLLLDGRLYWGPLEPVGAAVVLTKLTCSSVGLDLSGLEKIYYEIAGFTWPTFVRRISFDAADLAVDFDAVWEGRTLKCQFLTRADAAFTYDEETRTKLRDLLWEANTKVAAASTEVLLKYAPSAGNMDS